jgi:hypothetical protein
MKYEEEAVKLEDQMRSAIWMLNRIKGDSPSKRNQRGRRLQDINTILARAKLLSSQRGRELKKLKQFKKKHKVITLTECFGVPWRIVTKKG